MSMVLSEAVWRYSDHRSHRKRADVYQVDNTSNCDARYTRATGCDAGAGKAAAEVAESAGSDVLVTTTVFVHARSGEVVLHADKASAVLGAPVLHR
jgi:hypothetical protein